MRRSFLADEAEKFWSLVNKEAESGCWLWTGKTRPGRGVVWLKKTWTAHHVSWLLAGYDLPDQAKLSHVCGRDLCVNPDHLRLDRPDDYELEFWKNVERGSEDGCWRWRGKFDNNTPIFYFRGASEERNAARIAWKFIRGELAKDAVLRSACNNRACINPDHRRCLTDTETNFWASIEKNQDTGCWIWKGWLKFGKPTISIHGLAYLASNYAWKLAGREEIGRRKLNKDCGNELCVNPDHHSAARERIPTADRFWAKVDRKAPNECWPWTGYMEPGGYGMLRVRNKDKRAHILSLELQGVDIPKGLVINHKCNNRRCVNPDHLEVVTPKDNVEHMMEQGRHRAPSGSDSRNAKLNLEAANEIRRSAEQGVSKQDIASQYGISVGLAVRVIKNRAWVDLSLPTAPSQRESGQKRGPYKKRDPETIEEKRKRFFDKTLRSADTGCLIWTGARDDKGYGQVRFEDKKRVATHVAWYLTHGKYPSHFMCHTCDMPACVNPSHLIDAPHRVNVEHAKARNRYLGKSGEANPAAKLSDDDVSKIRKLYAMENGPSQYALAGQFGVSPQAIGKILLNDSRTDPNYVPPAHRLRRGRSQASGSNRP